MRHHRKTPLLAMLPALLGVAGCYIYVPVDAGVALTGRQASLALTDSGAVMLASRLGPGVAAIEGRYLGDSAGMHLMALSVVHQRSGAEADWVGEHVAIPHAYVASLSERRLSSSQTAIAGSLAAGVIVAVTRALRGAGEGGGGGPGPVGKTPGQ